MLERKTWRTLASPDRPHHLAAILFLPGRVARYHTHDFPEVFWIERGECVHEINGRTERLGGGDLVMVRPEDCHCLRATDERGFTLLNLAFAPRIRASLLRRHPRELTPLLAPSGPLPMRVRFGRAVLAGLRRQAEALGTGGAARVALEHFLLGLYLQTLPMPAKGAEAVPDWLKRACEDVQRPEWFALGAAGLVKRAGRSAEHVARCTRAAFGTTPSGYVNRVRMNHAARELRVSNRPIADVALECGLTNLSHFYRLFRAAHGLTPRKFRLQHQRAVV